MYRRSQAECTTGQCRTRKEQNHRSEIKVWCKIQNVKPMWIEMTLVVQNVLSIFHSLSFVELLNPRKCAWKEAGRWQSHVFPYQFSGQKKRQDHCKTCPRETVSNVKHPKFSISLSQSLTIEVVRQLCGIKKKLGKNGKITHLKWVEILENNVKITSSVPSIT